MRLNSSFKGLIMFRKETQIHQILNRGAARSAWLWCGLYLITNTSMILLFCFELCENWPHFHSNHYLSFVVVSCFCSQDMNISLGSSAFNSTQSSLLTTIVTAIFSLRCSYFHLKIMYHSRSEADVAQGASYPTGRL
jgi:hypothetical protein